VHGDQKACLKGETMGEPLVNEGEVESKVTVGRGNNQVGKKQNKANIVTIRLQCWFIRSSSKFLQWPVWHAETFDGKSTKSSCHMTESGDRSCVVM